MQHQQTSSSAGNLNSSKSSSNSSSGTTNGARHGSSNSTSASSNKNSSGSANTGATKLSGGNNKISAGATNNNNSSSNSNNNNSNHLNHNHHSNNSHHHGHPGNNNTSSPILPITPSTSVSPPINVICKKEITSSSSFHNSSAGSGNPNSSLDAGLPKSYIEAAALHQQHQQQQQQQHQLQQQVGKDGSESLLGPLSNGPLGLGHQHNSNLNAYAANLNARLGQTGSGTAGSGAAGNLTPLGSNSSIMTTPSPPITPQAAHNPLSYVPNHESYNFWHNQYNHQYPNNYQTPSSYYTQMDYFNNQTGQANYNMSHTGYTATNFGLAASGAMTAQTFSPNGLDYMNPQDKYVNMV